MKYDHWHLEFESGEKFTAYPKHSTIQTVRIKQLNGWDKWAKENPNYEESELVNLVDGGIVKFRRTIEGKQ